MNKDLRIIYYAFNGKLVGTTLMKLCVCQTLSKMPDKIIKHITANCWFIGSMDDAWAFTFTGNDLKDRHLIFLSDDLLRENKEQIYFSIAHEIGHVMLKHRNSTLIKQTPEEIRLQEKEANEFAKQYV